MPGASTQYSSQGAGPLPADCESLVSLSDGAERFGRGLRRKYLDNLCVWC